MNRSALQDLVTAGALVALCVFVLVTMGESVATNIVGSGGVTHATLPMLYAGLLLLLALLLLASALVRLRRSGGLTPAFSHPPVVWFRIASTLALSVAYVMLLKQLPFLPLTAAFLFALFLAYGHRSLLPAAVVALVGAAALDTLFLRILHLPI